MVWWAKTRCPDAPRKISKAFTGGSPRPFPRSSETGAGGLERVAGGTHGRRESRLRRGSRGDLPVHGQVPGTAPNRHHGPHARSLAERLLRLEESSPKLPRPGGRASQAGDPQRPRLPSRRVRRASNPRGTAGAGMAGGAQAGCPTDAGTWNRRSFRKLAPNPKGLASLWWNPRGPVLPVGARPAIHPGQTACNETRAAQFSRWGLDRRSIPAKQPVMKPTRPSSPGGGSAGDPSRLNRVASRRSSLRFGRNTPGPVLPVGAPPSRALSAGPPPGELAPPGELGLGLAPPGERPSALTRVPPPAVHRVAARRSSLRFGRNTPGPVLPVGAPSSRALSAGPPPGGLAPPGELGLAPTGRTGRPRRSRGFHHRLFTASLRAAHRLFVAARRCVSVAIHPGQFSRWGLLPHAPCQPGPHREDWPHRENWASPPPGELAGLGAHPGSTTGC